MSKFIYNKSIPDVMLPELKRLLEPWEWFIPSWCDRVLVNYDAAVTDVDTDIAASCETSYPYRWASIVFCPTFITQSDPVQDALHELCHIPVDILANWIERQIKILIPDEDSHLRKNLLCELEERTEMVTEDISARIAQEWRKKQ